MTKEENRISDYVCIECGTKYLTEKQKQAGGFCTTFHQGVCGLCQEEKSITHIRAYNYLRKPKNIT